MRFLSNFGYKLILCALSIFGISNIPTHCLKEALVTWPLSASGLSVFSVSCPFLKTKTCPWKPRVCSIMALTKRNVVFTSDCHPFGQLFGNAQFKVDRLQIIVVAKKYIYVSQLFISRMPKMRAIPQLVSVPLNPIPIAEHFRKSHPPCEHSRGQHIYCKWGK